MLVRLLRTRYRRFVPFHNAARGFSIENKSTEYLKDKFRSMTKEHDEKLSEELSEQVSEDIRVKDQSEVTDSLKSQFNSVKEDLSKNTGEAKTVYQRMKESYEAFSIPDIKMPEFKTWRRATPKEKRETPICPSVAPEPPSVVPKSPSVAPEPKVPWSEKYPKLSPLFSYTSKTSNYLLDAYLEAFPTDSYKQKQRRQKFLKFKKDKEIQDKIERGEPLGEDEQIPLWKKGALQVVQETPSSWTRAKTYLSDSKLGSILKKNRKTIMTHESMKEAQNTLSELKEGLSTLSETVKEQIEAGNSSLYSQAKDIWASAILETAQARAVRLIKQQDPDFDLYEFEHEMQEIVRNLYEKYLEFDREYISSVAEGQAIKFFEQRIDEFEKRAATPLFTVLADMNKPVFLNVNIEDKTNPKFTYIVSIKECVTSQNKVTQTSRMKEHYTWNNYHVTVVRHPDPDLDCAGHLWQVVYFNPSDEIILLSS